MAAVVPNVGEVLWLSVWTGSLPTQAPWQLRLFANDISPASTSTASSFVEVTAGGYASIALAPTNWVVTPGDPPLIEYPAQSFGFTGTGGNAYGYYITDVSGEVVMAERFGGPVTIAAGTLIIVTPHVALEPAGGAPE
jgi:hypothetical protein